MSASEIQSSVLDGAYSTSHVGDLTHEIANQDGFRFRNTAGGKKILGESEGSTPQPRIQTASRSTDSDHAQQDDQIRDQEQDDSDERVKITSDAAAEMDALINAEVATDGGKDT
ncbi:hypothetical protein HAPAU_39850 [Halalkalicoccus paucihalophilus]|uniref:Uncharacterized protein n=1 Tax=Halalkalicoccus paucihalophilus TaxID=1008153 RepID=A0A151A879_9EURY|nr:hypothetical protein [Halalkalicoccus paucihalophilus]KYH23906.1 hypothetical protein HAPAU_39850 [Halalkalicoccus paucihalophilus]